VAPQTGSSRRADVAGLTPDEECVTLISRVAQARLASVVRQGELTLPRATPGPRNGQYATHELERDIRIRREGDRNERTL
jgi:hypothetical protein